MSDYRPVSKIELLALATREGARIGKRLYKELIKSKVYYGDTFNFNYTCSYDFKIDKKETK